MSGMPKIGSLRHRVTLERERLVPDEAGSFTRTFVTLGDAWAEIRQKASRDLSEGQRQLRRDLFEVTLRARPGLAEADRLRWGDETFKVTGCRAGDISGRFLVLVCERDRGQ